ncbi:MAG: hypothetical protein ACJAU6_003910 [Alphaproteobacteria bacterium]|jgi:uncharacterized protein (TIGR02466 family)
MFHKVFDLPVYQSPVASHADTKDSVMREIMQLREDPRCYQQTGNERVYSDYMIADDPSTRKYKDEVIGSVKPNIEEFSREMGAAKIDFGQIWFQRYETNSFHGVHNHWPSLFSAVYYLEFDPQEHKPTAFVNPNKLQVALYRNRNLKFSNKFSPDGSQGDLLIFPGFLDHYAPINVSDKPRTIISFNFDLSA